MWKLPTLRRQRSRKHSCHGEMVHLSDVRIVSIKQRRGVGNYVSQAAEDNSCTAITLICSGLWGDGVSSRGNQAVGACIRWPSESENGSCQLQALLWMWVGFSPCAWRFSTPFCPWMMTNQGGGWVIAFQHLLIHRNPSLKGRRRLSSTQVSNFSLNLLTFADWLINTEPTCRFRSPNSAAQQKSPLTNEDKCLLDYCLYLFSLSF